MARIRTIKPEFFQSQSVGRLSPWARLLFIGLWTQADDAGRCRGAPQHLAGILFGYDGITSAKIDTWLQELVDQGMIARYVVGGSDYIEVLNWLDHQRINRPSPAQFPPFSESSLNPHGALTEDSLRDPHAGARALDQGSGIRDQGSRSTCSDEQVSSQATTNGHISPEQLQAAWNEMAARAGLPKIMKLTEKRKRLTRERLRSHSAEEVLTAIRKIGESRFCRGERSSRGWRANLDFLFRVDRVQEILEGKYDEHDPLDTVELP